MLPPFTAPILGYLLGSAPFSALIGRLAGGVDVRAQGSGNPGATNVTRLLGWRWGALALLLDAGKGAAAVALAGHLAGNSQHELYWRCAAGGAAVAGHIWSVFTRFRGGKGVATAAGVFFALYPLVAGVSAAVFIIIAAGTRLVSLASLTATLCAPATMLALKYGFGGDTPPEGLALGFAVFGMVAYAHRTNIARLWRGEEQPFSPKKRRD